MTQRRKVQNQTLQIGIQFPLDLVVLPVFNVSLTVFTNNDVILKHIQQILIESYILKNNSNSNI